MTRKVRSLLLVMVAVALSGTFSSVRASDHDDGEYDAKGRSVNLTDLYVFKEGDQTGVSADNANLILIMNSNPRSVARQQYFFSSTARYEFHVSRVTAAAKATQPTGSDDVILRFAFSAQDSNNRQAITVTAIKDGATTTATTTTGGATMVTSSLADSKAGTITNNSFTLGSSTLTVFAGLREDPFFFDVERFFKVRATLADPTQASFLNLGTKTQGDNTGATYGLPNPFRDDTVAVDFTAGYNVNSIVVRVPITFLQSSAAEPVFDVWTTVSVPR